MPDSQAELPGIIVPAAMDARPKQDENDIVTHIAAKVRRQRVSKLR